MDLVCIEGVANNDILCFMKNSGVGNEIDDVVRSFQKSAEPRTRSNLAKCAVALHI